MESRVFSPKFASKIFPRKPTMKKNTLVVVVFVDSWVLVARVINYKPTS